MKTKAVRLYGKNDLRLEEFELPSIKEDEILVKIVSDSICMSSWKATIQGEEHKRIPKNINKNPIIIGHEFCGEIIEVGNKWKDKFKPKSKFVIQPAINSEKGPVGILSAPGYSYTYCGGAATYAILPAEIMEKNCLIEFSGDSFFKGSLAEPLSCIIGAFHSSYHSKIGEHKHKMGIVERGNMAILAGAGPMGIGAVDYTIHGPVKPSLLVVTDIDENRLKRSAKINTEEEAKKFGIKLIYLNTNKISSVEDYLMSLTEGKGYDDIFIFAPVESLIKQADAILGFDGCINFFAGPSNPDFKAEINFYKAHYLSTHIAATSGGNIEDLYEALELTSKNLINPASMISHIGGLDAVIDTTLNLPKIPGAKKLIYTGISLKLTSLEEIPELAKKDKFFAGLSEILSSTNGLWSKEAEDYLLNYGTKI